MAVVGPVRVTNQLDEALAEFNGRLTFDEKARFRAQQTNVPDATAVVAFMAQLDQDGQNRRGRCIASRLFSFLTSIQEFSSIVGTFVSSNPTIAALIWGSVRFMLQFANNSFGYFDHLSLFLIDIGKLCPRFSDYQSLYPKATKLQSELQNFFAEIIRCCTQICEVLRRPNWLSLVRSAWTPFDTEFHPFKTRIQDLASNVKHEIKIAAGKAADEERQTQNAHRTIWKQRKDDKSLEKQRQSQTTRRQCLLDRLSTYDYNTGYGLARRSGSKGTAGWIVKDPQFEDWMSSSMSSVFWLSVGCGKTVLMSNAVAHLYLQQPKATQIAYFFCRFNQDNSLQSATILRSILRQYLSVKSLDDELETTLSQLLDNTSIQPADLTSIFELVLSKTTTLSRFLVIDGIDECGENERQKLLKSLRDIVLASPAPIKLMLSSRNREPNIFRRTLLKFHGMLVNDDVVQTDIATYVATELESRQNCGELVIGDQTLVPQIQESLVAGAKSMFLWVALQLDEICCQDCDHDIRESITNLPETLQETYQRMLDRIIKRQRSKRAKEVFQWIIIARRPLTLYELQEALAVEKFSEFSQPDRYINDISNLIPSCEGFLILDETNDEVSLAHPTMASPLIHHLAPKADKSATLTIIDKEIGEICVTFLNFNDFKTGLIKRNAMQDVTADQLFQASLEVTSVSHKFTRPLLKFSRSRSSSPKIGHVLQVQSSQSAKKPVSQQNPHPFLAYASEHWLSHSTGFQTKDRIWPLWRRLVLDDEEDSIAFRPWSAEAWAKRDETLQDYIVQHDHVPLLTLTQSGLVGISTMDLGLMLEKACSLGKFRISVVLYKIRQDPNISTFLRYAARNGHIRIVQLLLQSGMDVDCQLFKDGVTPLQAASEEGHLEVAEVLIAAGANVNAQGGKYGNALQAASDGGHIAIVQLLLYSGADIHKRGGFHSTAFQAAVSQGHDAVLKVLLDEGANFDDYQKDASFSSALDSAVTRGHEKVARLLLLCGAADECEEHGKANLLRSASNGGHIGVVKLLLEAGWDVNAKSNDHNGTNALHAASLGGHTEVLKVLLDAGANVNAQGGHFGNALQAAVFKGYDEAVRMLLDAGADVNARGGNYVCALQAATDRRHDDLARLLRSRGAKKLT